MCWSDSNSSTKNKGEKRCGKEKHTGKTADCCCDHDSSKEGDLNLLKHRLECFTGKISNIKNRIEELNTNNK
jgi:hypothetical protein